jgi:hypothetical protein
MRQNTFRVLAGALLLAVGAGAARPAAQQIDPKADKKDQKAQGLSGSPTRDTPAQPGAPTPTGRITGRVLAADSGRPVKRARVFVSAAEMPGGRGMLTDDSGVFDLAELPAGRYTLTVSKSGFVSLSYGQRRPLQAGTPLQLNDGQQLKGVDFQLPRGGVISGRILDEDGEPVPGASVSVMRYQYQQGERRLSQAGNGQTDDRGQFRVWGLMPGDYYINALARQQNFGGPFGGPFGGGRGGPAAGPGGGRGGRGAPAAVSADDQEQLNYAPTYYPGVTNVDQARPITLGVSQELGDINFNLQLVRTALISGHVINPDGTPTTSGNVQLMPEAGTTRGVQIGRNVGSRIQWDGAFALPNVPPGRYVIRARGQDTDPPQYASTAIAVTGEDVDDVRVVLQPGGSLTGTVSFLPGGTPVPDITQMRITAPSTEQGPPGPQPNARVDKDGKFSMDGVSAGPHLIRPNGGMRGWVLKAVTINGRDVTDTPIDVRSGQTVSNVAIVFTDKQNEISGTITDQSGTPMPDYTVLAFPTDSTLWRPQARQIMTTRPDQTGKYRIRGLPTGEYFLATVDPAEQGEWFDPGYLEDHRAGAARVNLGDGDVKTQDFRVSLR